MESRSTFVTVLAWIFIVGAGFTSLISVIQVIMVSSMFSGDEFGNLPDNAPGMAKFMSRYFYLIVYGFFSLSLFTFVSSIALLKRKNWARLAFIVILSFGVLWQLGGLLIQFFMFSDFPSPPSGKEFEDFERMSNIIRLFSFVISILISAIFIWVIKKLVTQPIVGEFTLNKKL